MPGGPPRLVERERELAACADLVTRARDGAGGVVVVEGPPGIGKTSLLAALRADVPGVTVLGARGSELERSFAFGVVRQLLEPVVATADRAGRAVLLAGAGALASRVLDPPEAGDDGDEPPLAALHGLYWLTANLAASAPVLLLVDDAQWADPASLRWLAYLAQRIDGVPVAVVLAVRTGPAGAPPGLLDEIAAAPTARVVRVAPLSPAAVGAVVGAAVDGPPDARFSGAVHAATGGNPFLVRELLVEVGERGIAPTAAAAAAIGDLSAPGVERAIRTRLGRAGAEATALARAVAVLGDGVDLGLAARVAALDEPVARAAADDLAAVGILDDGRPLVFTHPLVRAAVYAELPAGRREEAHARAAAALRADGAPDERVAGQLLAGPGGGDEAVATVLRAAAAAARGRGDPAGAVAYLRRARQAAVAPELDARLCAELGGAALQAGDLAEADARLADAVARLPDDHARARAALERSTVLALTARFDEAVAALDDAIARLDVDREADRELGLLAQATRFVTANMARPDASATAAAPRFTPPPGPPTTTGARLHLAEQAAIATLRTTAAEACGLARAALDGWEPRDESTALWSVYAVAPGVLLQCDALDEALRAWTAMATWAGRHGAVADAQAVAHHVRATVWWRRGALAEAESDARFGLDDERSVEVLVPSAVPLVEVLLARGDLAGAVATWPPDVLGALPAAGIHDIPRCATAAHLLAAVGRPGEARAALAAVERIEAAWDIRTPAFSQWRSDAALLELAAGDRAAARRLADDEVERALAFGSDRALGIARRAAGLVHGGTTGIEQLAASVAVLAPSAARLEHATSLVELGAALRRAGRRTEATGPLRDGLDAAACSGAAALARRAHDELVTVGARPRRDPVESRARLTASELRVARLAADGATNREIAQTLFVTEKTVELHLSNTYRKLEIRSRSQLPRALAAAPA